jgi:hypothetical protein
LEPPQEDWHSPGWLQHLHDLTVGYLNCAVRHVEANNDALESAATQTTYHINQLSAGDVALQYDWHARKRMAGIPAAHPALTSKEPEHLECALGTWIRASPHHVRD